MLTDLLAGSPEETAAQLAKLSVGERLHLARALNPAFRGMAAYIRWLELGFEPAAHHRALIAELEAVERGECDRLMVLMPPGSAKSTYTSVVFPAWYLGRNPTKSVIAASHTQDLIERFGRRARNLYSSPEHYAVFGGGVAKDSGAAARWDTDRGGEYFAVGIGGAVAGRRADLGLIDDPVRSREDADSERVRDKTWDWYINDYLTRLKPGAAQCVVMCMTGDTPVLMSDGTERLLRSIRRGDTVATYEYGTLSTAKVLNWKNQGNDFVYEIRMISGITVRANERHPFLVLKDGDLQWLRLRDLTVGDEIVRVTPQKELGQGLSAGRPVVKSRQGARASVCRTMAGADGRQDIERRQPITRPIGIDSLDIGMVLNPGNMTGCLRSKMDYALSAESRRQLISLSTGEASSPSIIAMKPGKLGRSSATTAITLSEKERPSECFLEPLNIFEIIPDLVSSITPYGAEEVFDIQVERTENFIANGLVSHNTRWHEDDLGGRILAMEPGRWRIMKLPMAAGPDDPLGRAPGERLWPEWFTEEMMRDAQRDTRAWNALYQQEPAADEGDYFKREWFREFDIRPTHLNIYGASDYAVTEGHGDFTEHGVFGVDDQGNVYVLDWWSGQAAADVWIEAQLDLIMKHKPLCWFGEAGPIRRAVEPFLLRRKDERNIRCRFEWLASVHDKPTRCRTFQALASSEKVFFPQFAGWKSDVVGQLTRFPAGMHDDKVDVCSLIGRGLEHVRPPRVGAAGLPAHANVAHATVKTYSPQYRGVGRLPTRANLGYAQGKR